MPAERLQVMKDVDDTMWNRIKTACAFFDVEEKSNPENIWDVRDYGTEDDVIFLWGRDGWRDGFWHARIVREDTDVWMERGPSEKSNPLTQSRKRFVNIVQPLLTPAESNDETGTPGPDTR